MKITNFIPLVLLCLAGLVGNYIAHGKVDSLRASVADERRAVSQLRQDLQQLPSSPKNELATDLAALPESKFDADEWIVQFSAEDQRGGDSKHKLIPQMLEQLEDCFDSDLADLMFRLKEPGASDGETMPFFIAALLYAEREPEKALDFALEQKIGNEFLEGAFGSFTKKNLRQAWDWLSEQRVASTLNDGPRKRLERILATQLADRDPAMFAEFALSIPEDNALTNLLNAGFVLQDSEKSRAIWSALSEHPELSAKQGLQIDKGYLAYLARVEGPAAAARLLEGQMAYQDEEERAQSIAKIAFTVQMEDGAAAADWLVSYADDTLLAPALPPFVRQWVQTDYNAAGEWLGKLPPSPTRDAAVAEFAGLIGTLYPEAAKVWIETIRDEGLRESLLKE